MYAIEFVRSAQKEFKNLKTEDKKRIISVLERIRIRPFEFALRLSGSKAYRIRAGKLRIILDVEQKEKNIKILKIGNMENIYLP